MSLPRSASVPTAGVLGSTIPRLYTPPLVIGPPGPCPCRCALTPETSYGFDVIEFARDVLMHPLDPWQEFAVIHAGELLPDGRPRFRIVVILVARQNGKTELLVVLSLFWQFVEAHPLILGTSTTLNYAKESWIKAVKLAEKSSKLDELRPARWKREANGEQESWTDEESRYKIAASNPEGGRSLTISKLILDELRQHHSYAAWDASEPATSAVPDAQIFCLSNAGDHRSVVLNDLHGAALDYIATGEGDERLGLLEWSCPADADPLDVNALAMANPNLGYRKDADVLLAAARRAVSAGGDALTGFKTESMCINVPHLDPAVDPGGWRRCLDIGDMSELRSRVALCFDIAPDGQHATLAAGASMPDGRVRIEVVKAWEGRGCVDALRRELHVQVARVKPQVVGWYPGGPAAAFAADMAKRPGWPPAGVTVSQIKGESAAVCMGFAEQVEAGMVAHSDDPLLNAHVGGAERLRNGATWVFSRRGSGHCDAAYAAAGAIHLARILPPPVGKPRLIVVP